MPQNIPKTELLFKNSKPIDSLSITEAISLMVQEQSNATLEVKKAAKSIERVIEAIHRHLTLNSKGRIIYGAEETL